MPCSFYHVFGHPWLDYIRIAGEKAEDRSVISGKQLWGIKHVYHLYKCCTAMEAYEFKSRWKLHLEEADPGAHYRVSNLPNEINREAIINRGETFQVTSDLVEVVHGTLRPPKSENDGKDDGAGEPGTLIVIDFQLVPKLNRRFSKVLLTIVFTADKSQNIVVSVAKMMPHKTWALCPTTQNDESSWKLNPTVAVPAASVTVGELGWSHTQTKAFHTSVEGAMRFENRDSGGKDAARWVLGENNAQKTGVARRLRVAVVVRLRDEDGGRLRTEDVKNLLFNAMVTVRTTVPFWYKAEERMQWLNKKMPVDDPVVFKYGRDRTSSQLPVSVDKENLLGVDLERIIDMGLQRNFDELAKARGH